MITVRSVIATDVKQLNRQGWVQNDAAGDGKPALIHNMAGWIQQGLSEL